MHAFVVLGLVFPYQAKRLAWECLWNDLFCAEWDIKLSQSVSVIAVIALGASAKLLFIGPG